MRVVVNRLSLLGQRTGVGHYTAGLLRGLAGQAGADRIDCFPSGWFWQAQRLWYRIRSSDAGAAAEAGAAPPVNSPSALARLKRSARRGFSGLTKWLGGRDLRTVLRRRPCDLYHEPNHIPVPCDCRTLVTLHDISALLYPEWHPRSRIAWYEANFARTLTQACHFLTDTDFTRQEVIRRLNVPADRVTRVHLGIRRGLAARPAAQTARTLRRLGLPPRYLLHVGTIEPRKNLGMLLRAYCALPGPLRERWPLLLVGPWGWNAGDVAEYLYGEARHRGVIHLGYVAERHLAAVYSGARALIYPTLYEGFGFPPLEMLACGGAVIASTAGAIVETVGDTAHLLDPLDLEGWRDAMRRVVEDDDWWHGLRRRAVEAVRRFTWERCAAETLRVYRSLGGAAEAGRRLAG